MVIDFKADLHCHTSCSDGTVSPIEIVKLAKEKGLKGLSITDHDTIAAYETAMPLAKSLDFPLIPGVEFSASHQDVSIHVLAYSFPIDSPLIKEFCLKHQKRRLHRNREILRLLTEHNMPITEAEIEESASHEFHTIGRPHIALAMVKRGYVSAIQEAFHHYIGDGKLCYAPGGYFSVTETIDLIHQAKGLAVIAHPHLISHYSILNDLLEMNFDGIEGYYARFPAQQQERWIKIGEKKKWIITGGSDFHGQLKPDISLGSSWVGEKTFSLLYTHYLQNS